MNDKYEDAADEWYRLTEGIDGVLLKDAFRWYEERYLAKTSEYCDLDDDPDLSWKGRKR